MDLDSNEMEKTLKIDDELDVEGHFTTDMIFPSKYCLVEWVRNVASGLGFVATIQRADKIDGRPKPRVFVGCDRSGFARDNQQRKGYVCKNLRRTSSKRCGCKFLLLGQKMAYAEEWKITVKCGLHNHKFVHLEAHSFAGRLDDEEQKIVEEMYGSGVKPRKILASLKKRDSSNVSIMRTIYNEKVKLFKKELDGGTPIQFHVTMPDMGLVISSCYNVMVVHISKFQSFTFLPLHSAPTTVKKTIYIGFVNNNHYIQLIVQKDCPLPPVISLWMTYHSEIAAEWNLSFEGQDYEIVNLTDP